MISRDEGQSPAVENVATVAALLLVHDGANSGELADRFSSLCAAFAEPESAARLLSRLAELGLVRTDRRRPEGPRYFLTATGEQHTQATLAGQPELAVGLAGLEQLRTDLLSTVAHELRTPLTAVRTSVGVLLDPQADVQPGMRTNLLQTISHNAERMQRLVTDVLELTRFRMRGMQLQLRRFDAVALARDLATSFNPVLETRKQVLELDAPTRPLWVYGDHRRLEQAITNLVSNAHKFSRDYGTITFTVRSDGADVIWTVQDEGIGIAPEDRPRLFERFFSAPIDAAGQRAGTGLGLPLALAIAQSHGGGIDVESALGRGSTFALRVPVDGPPGEDEV
jgi:signal transduction histidine kinase